MGVIAVVPLDLEISVIHLVLCSKVFFTVMSATSTFPPQVRPRSRW